MYRAALQTSARALRASRPTNLASTSRRFASTTAAPRKGTWRGAAVRWGLAVGAVYWYNTSPLFADELTEATRIPPPPFSDADNQTVDALLEEKRRQTVKSAPPPPPPEPKKSEEALAASPETKDETALAAEALEAEAGQQGAFNPETGEINWDCPCLGGMAHGPCGEEFKAAFSCFVYSEEEPKGMECIDKFQHMQDCFRLHPEIYAAELADDEDESPEAGVEAAAPTDSPRTTPEPPKETQQPAEQSPSSPPAPQPSAIDTRKPAAFEEKEAARKTHDATDANKSVKQ